MRGRTEWRKEVADCVWRERGAEVKKVRERYTAKDGTVRGGGKRGEQEVSEIRWTLQRDIRRSSGLLESDPALCPYNHSTPTIFIIPLISTICIFLN